MFKKIEHIIGETLVFFIRTWVRVCGRKVQKNSASWLNSPMGEEGHIGTSFYRRLAEKENLNIVTEEGAGLLEEFSALKSPMFDPGNVHPLIREFYEHTSRFRLEAWSEAPILTRFFLWLLTRFVSRKMDQLNFPVSSLELAGGMTSTILPMKNKTGERVFTGWLRQLVKPPRVIYTGLYSVETPPLFGFPCIKVSFPVPRGSSTVFLRPEVMADGSFRLLSSGSKFGEPGFYRMINYKPEHWRVLYIRSLQEHFYLYLDPSGNLRCEHLVYFLGLKILCLHYKIERVK